MRAVAMQARDNFYRGVAEQGGEVLEPEWLGSNKPHLCRCAQGHECRPHPSSIRIGQGLCLTCAGLDSATAWKNFRQKVAEQGGEVLEPEWLGSNKPHRCRCSKGHECRPRPDSIRQGGGMCWACSGRNTAVARDNFYRRVAERDGEVLDLVWRGNKKRYLCRCPKGHECYPVPNGLQQGEGMCRICTGLDPATAWADFRCRIAEQGGEVLEERWLGSGKPHRCRCANGHECAPWPTGIQSGQGMCRICVGLDTETARDRFYQIIATRGGEVLEPKWLGAKTPHLCRCPKGHECNPRLDDIQRGIGMCVVCSRSGRDAVYVVRDPEKRWVKFGITSRDGSFRLYTHRRHGFTEVLYLKTGLPEDLAALTENKIKIALSMAGAWAVRGTEYFSDENLALIESEISNWIPEGQA